MAESDGKVKLELSAETADFVASIKAASEQFKAAFGTMEKAAAESATKLDKAFGALKFRSLGEIKKEADQVRAAFDTITASAGKTSAEGQRAFRAMQDRLKALDAEAKGVRGSVASIGDASGLNSLMRNLLTTAAAFLSLRAAVNTVKQVIDIADNINDLTKKTGISAETLSLLKPIAEQSGTSIEGLATGLKFLAKSMSEAANGSKEDVATFKQLGVSATDSAGKLRPVEDVLMDIADVFAAMPAGAKKSELAMKVFGKAGADLIPFLDQGRFGIEALMVKMRELGVEMSGTTVKAADEFNDSLNDIKQALTGVMLQALKELLPTLQEFARNLVDAIKDKDSGIRTIANAFVVLSKAVVAVIKFVIRFGKELALVAGTLAALSVIGKISAALTVLGGVLPAITAGITAMRAAMTGLLVVLGTAATALGVVKAAILLLPAAIYAGGAIVEWFFKKFEIGSQKVSMLGPELQRYKGNLEQAVKTHQQFNAVIERLDNAKMTAAAEAVRKLKQAALENPGAKDELLEKAQEFASKVSGLQKRLDSERAELATLEKQRQDILRTGTEQTEKAKIDFQIEQTKRLLEQRKQAIDEAVRLEKQYAEAAIQWGERAAQARLSTADKLRDLSRKGMSEEAQQADIAAQAQEKLSAASAKANEAQRAAREGNAKAAEKAAQETERLASQADSLAGRLKDAGAAAAVIQQAGTLIEQSARSAQAANEQAAASMASSIAKQKTELAGLQQQLKDIETKKLLIEVDVKIDAARKSIADIEKEIGEAYTSLQAFAKTKGIDININAIDDQAKAKVAELQKPTESQHTVRPEARAAQATISALQQPTSSVHTIYIRKVEQNAAGGPVGFAGGGGVFRRMMGAIRGPGTATSDSIPAMLSDGEYVLRASAVRRWGLDFLNALNSGFMPAMAPPRYALGGLVGDSGGSSGDEVTINLNMSGQKMKMRSSRDTAMQLAGALRELARGA